MKDLEKLLRDKGAWHYFESLVSSGCNKFDLLNDLAEFNSKYAQDSWTLLIGTSDTRSFAANIKLIRQCATTIDAINGHTLITGYIMGGGEIAEELRKLALPLPESLKRYADFLDHEKSHIGPKTRLRQNTVKARVTAYVKYSTGNYHDKEVSHLIAAVLDQTETYTEAAHLRWRHAHKPDIEEWFPYFEPHQKS